MCMEHSIMCTCGKRNASFNFKDDMMPPEIVRRLYCPSCSADLKFDPSRMVSDNEWVIEYDMDVAELYGRKLPFEDRVNLSADLLFDSGYATWRGVYPGDHIDSARERSELAALSKVDPRKYLEELKDWSINRMARLRKEGWRKAHERERI